MRLLAIIAIAIVLGVSTVSILFNKRTRNDEMSNVQALVTQANGILNPQGKYPFTGGANMISILYSLAAYRAHAH